MVKIVKIDNIRSIINDRMNAYTRKSYSAIVNISSSGEMSFSVLSTRDLRMALKDDNVSFSSVVQAYMSLNEAGKKSFVRKIRLYSAYHVSGIPQPGGLLETKIKKLISDNKIMRVHELSGKYLGIRFTSQFLEEYFGGGVGGVTR